MWVRAHFHHIILHIGKGDSAVMDRKKKNGVASLTDREQEILQLIWNGLKNREIGSRLKISVKTVEAHRANMMKKLRVSNAAQLLKAAIEEGFIRVRRG